MTYTNLLRFAQPPEALLAPIVDAIQQTPHSAETLEHGHGHANVPSELVAWLNEHVMQGDWYIQYFIKDQPKHRDKNTSSRFLYFLSLGGENVHTSYYTDDQLEVIESNCFECKNWYVLKTDVYHDVQGMQPGELRIAISARIFGYHASHLPSP